ncbi:MAG: hypothetical protein E2O61_12615 [Gammaproteobacteria bacterium]|nr:MAG: hypothetical protein E2O61_12615 [Gammaproteobacteria bacterium]
MRSIILHSKINWVGATLLTMILASPGVCDAAAGAFIPSSDKGGFQYSEPTDWPEQNLDLSDIERQVAEAASLHCGTALAAAPLDLGNAKSFMGEMMGKAASAAVGKLLGSVLGGGGGRSSKQKKPKMFKDPIKKKYKTRFEDPQGKVRVLVGGKQFNDGLLLSARVDKARGKGTFHTMFLERPDCTRIWPIQYMGYGLWGKWSLSVSVTKTTSTYRDGELIDRSVERSGWSKSGDFDFSRGFSVWDQLDNENRMVLNPNEAFKNQLRTEIGDPAWRQMGYAEPTEGIRSAGGLFRVNPEELTPGTVAVIHITNVEQGRYRTVGFPFHFSAGEDGMLTLEQLDTAGI